MATQPEEIEMNEGGPRTPSPEGFLRLPSVDVSTEEEDDSDSSSSSQWSEEEDSPSPPPRQKRRPNTPDNGLTVEEASTLLEEIKEVVVCEVCQMFLESGSVPAQCSNGHYTCQPCFRGIERAHVNPIPQCPSCRSIDYKIPQLNASLTKIHSVIAKYIRLPCPYQDQGCTFIARASEMPSHSPTCYYVPYPCPNIRCGNENCWATMASTKKTTCLTCYYITKSNDYRWWRVVIPLSSVMDTDSGRLKLSELAKPMLLTLKDGRMSQLPVYLKYSVQTRHEGTPEEQQVLAVSVVLLKFRREATTYERSQQLYIKIYGNNRGLQDGLTDMLDMAFHNERVWGKEAALVSDITLQKYNAIMKHPLWSCGACGVKGPVVSKMQHFHVDVRFAGSGDF